MSYLYKKQCDIITVLYRIDIPMILSYIFVRSRGYVCCIQTETEPLPALLPPRSGVIYEGTTNDEILS